MNPTVMHDEVAEQSVIGGVLLDNRILASIPTLEPGDFAITEHQHLFAAMRQLEARGLPIDLVTVRGEIDRWAKQRGVVPLNLDGTLGICAYRCPTPDNVTHYAEIVQRHKLTRETLRVLVGLVSAAQNGSLQGAELVSEAAGEILRLGDGKAGPDPGQTVAAISLVECDQLAREMDQEISPTATGMPTGLLKLDALTGGIPFAVTTMLLARPGMGKTTLAENIAWCAAELGNDAPILYSYEDSHASFAQRSIAQNSAVATEKIRARRLAGHDLGMIHGAKKSLRGRREIIVRAAGMNVDELIRDLRARRMRGATDGSSVGRLVIVDYVQNMPEPAGANRNERIGVISRKLAECAAKDGIALIVCSQVSRAVEKRDDNVPTLADARDCGELEQHAKLVIGLYRPWRYGSEPTGEEGGAAPPTLLELHVLKNHNGKTDCHAEVFWDLETHTICDSSHDLPARRFMGGRHANGN